MNCQQTTEKLSMWLDGELPDEAAVLIENHLASCATCSTQANKLQALNQQLEHCFGSARMRSQRVADRVADQLSLQNQHTTPRLKRTGSSSFPPLAIRIGWLVSLVAATAAGFLAAMIWLPSTPEVAREPSATEVLTGSPFATVAFATGPLEFAPIASSVYSCSSIPVVDIGMKMRTGLKKCELRTSDGTTIRLDSDTVVYMPKKNELVLEQGRLWCRQIGEEPMTVNSGGAAVKVGNAVCGIECGAEATELMTLEGNVEVVGGKWSGRVDAGKKMSYNADTVLAESRVDDPIIATRWVNDLLLHKHENDAELRARVEQLWAALGYAKLQNLYEDELRSLGDACVAPLTSYLMSDDKVHQQKSRRIQAAKIVADVAGFQSVPFFVELLEDADPDVRSCAASGLERLTGRNMGVTAEQWANASSEERAQWLADWQAWLRDRNEWFPAVQDKLMPNSKILPTKA